MRSPGKSVEVGLLAVVSTWEAVALLTRRVPTVTSAVMRLPRPARRVVTAAVCVWLVRHWEA